MLIEIPDVIVIVGVIIAFIAGMVGVYAYHRMSLAANSNSLVSDAGQSERLEYYERQLIDMKIRLDTIEMHSEEQKVLEKGGGSKHFVEESSDKKEEIDKITSIKTEFEKPIVASNIDHLNLQDYVLHLITQHDMTSRDIKITLKKSREHTARLMKKLFEEGYVERRAGSKPFVYSITKKGRDRLEKQTTAD